MSFECSTRTSDSELSKSERRRTIGHTSLQAIATSARKRDREGAGGRGRARERESTSASVHCEHNCVVVDVEEAQRFLLQHHQHRVEQFVELGSVEYI